MSELMNTGMRIQHFRILRGMTQKALGVAVGFPRESTDIRIAQYESGVRTPKHSLICSLAQTLLMFLRLRLQSRALGAPKN